MASQPRPKVLMFDIGGVCVVSPFQAILDYEIQHGIPKGYINYAIRELTPNGAWHKLERGEIPNDANFMRGFKADLERPEIWAKFQRERLGVKERSRVPPVPTIDAETLYWTMMSTARQPDPYMYPALKRLKASGQYKLAALSNTTIFPDGHEYNVVGPDDVRHIFEIFVSSAHVGMRKPNRDIYELALKLIRERWGHDIAPHDIVFLDDIGENLKTAKSLGIRTIRVVLGRTNEAVKELEAVTGLHLLEEQPPTAKL
ncbi:microsomal epoxide hydrolase [Capronia epimyces CBS 606.96]|uniref:Microsomal epoxide hydrolase n=1 Tax=Capronia epimyces CBS 606.96 TaxID=1182542 RepID=W9Y8U6_9EURO|nr:microsomal epoxide hydrolase [Capronia epimyces CBS 606.96]EXJ89272.1 microsomal epoxide hydrolase [Capronia epimyces CBS 606.96]